MHFNEATKPIIYNRDNGNQNNSAVNQGFGQQSSALKPVKYHKKPLLSKSTDSVNSEDDYKNKIRKSACERTEWQHSFPWDYEVNLANETVFGNKSFRENQKEVINATKSGKDVMALIPTGGGKSLTFQLSAVTDSGVTIVVMPLLSLIEDNLNFVLGLGI